MNKHVTIHTKMVQPEQPGVTPDEPVLRSFQPQPANDMKQAVFIMIIVFLVLIGFGVLTGYVLAGGSKGSSKEASQTIQVQKTDKSAGVSDTSTFKDTAEGTLQKGGIDGEGTHSLIRDGGPSQTVYMISSVVDLDEYVGKKVKVWGATLSAKKAGWLMDVGKIQLVE